MKNRSLVITRVTFFCLLNAVVLAAVSGVTKGVSFAWKQQVILCVTISITFLLIMGFTKWEQLTLHEVGIVPHKSTVKKVGIGFGIGLLMALLQPVFIVLLGHYTIAISPSISFYSIVFYLTLYILAAIREELSFRSYPLFSLNYSIGLWPSQLIIMILFSLEHVAGGMTWIQAFLGAGTGALLFGFAALKTKGIALPAGLHAAWNFGQWSMGFKKETGLANGIVETGFEAQVDRNAWISYLVIMAIGIVAFYSYRPKKTRVIST